MRIWLTQSCTLISAIKLLSQDLKAKLDSLVERNAYNQKEMFKLEQEMNIQRERQVIIFLVCIFKQFSDCIANNTLLPSV
jgi:hypothetical protein